MKHIKRWTALVVIFLSGIIIGVYGGISYTRKQVREFAGRGPQMYIGHLMRDITLTAEQQGAIDRVIDEMREQSEFLHSLYFPQYRKIIDDTVADIKDQLSSDQRKQLEQNRKDMEKRWKKRPRRRRRPEEPGESNRPPREQDEPGPDQPPEPEPEPDRESA